MDIDALIRSVGPRDDYGIMMATFHGERPPFLETFSSKAPAWAPDEADVAEERQGPERGRPMAGLAAALIAEAARAARRWEGGGPVGVRMWNVNENRLLRGAAVELTWWGSTVRAVCDPDVRWDAKPPHAAPRSGCMCGIYAVRPEAASVLLTDFLAHFVVGVVSLWGRVIRHEHGWRAEFATIREAWWIHRPPLLGPRVEAYPGVTWHRVEAWRGGFR